MRINWGTGLFIFFTCFVLTLGFILYKSRQIDNSLVVDKYYDQDIKYQSHYDKIQNLKNTGKDVAVTISKDQSEANISFPHNRGSQISGTIIMYKASDKGQDFSIPFDLTNDSLYQFSTKTLSKGKWKIKLDYTADGVAYYKEEDIYL
jgi:hypothetical protein